MMGRLSVTLDMPSRGTLPVIRLFVSDKKEALLEVEGGLEELRQWLSENIDALSSESIPLCFPSGSSIAEKAAKFYEEYEPDYQDDGLLDVVYAYRERHDIRFGLRGYDVPSIYIGNHEGEMEISRAEEEGSWCFNFDGSDLREILTAITLQSKAPSP